MTVCEGNELHIHYISLPFPSFGQYDCCGDVCMVVLVLHSKQAGTVVVLQMVQSFNSH